MPNTSRVSTAAHVSRVENLAGWSWASMEPVIRRHSPVMLRLAHRCAASEEAAMDAVVDVWRTVFESTARSGDAQPFDLSILGAIVQRSRALARRECTRTRVGAPAPLQTAACLRSVVDVARCTIESLPEIQRLIVSLRDVDRGSTLAVDRVLQIDDAAQRIELHDARTQILRSISQWELTAR